MLRPVGGAYVDKALIARRDPRRPTDLGRRDGLVSRHRIRRNWMPLVAGLVGLTVTGGVIAGFAATTGSPPFSPVASTTAAKVTGPVVVATPTPSVAPNPAVPVVSPPIDSRRAAYLAALNKAGISTVDEPTLLLIASGVCAQHQASETKLIRQVLTLFPRRWAAKDANTLVDCAKMFFCG